jgi:hypothetical protein
MISTTEYQKAKAIVDEYERQEYEDGMRQAEEDLDFDTTDDTCDACGCDDGKHMRSCPYDDSPFSVLCREGYD